MYQDSSAQNSQRSRSVSFVHQLKLICSSDEFYFTYAAILLSPVFTYTSVVYGNMLPHIYIYVLPCSRFRSVCNTSNYVQHNVADFHDCSPGKLAQWHFLWLLCIREYPFQISARSPSILIEGFFVFCLFLQTNSRIMPLITTQSLSSAFFPINYSPASCHITLQIWVAWSLDKL